MGSGAGAGVGAVSCEGAVVAVGAGTGDRVVSDVDSEVDVCLVAAEDVGAGVC